MTAGGGAEPTVQIDGRRVGPGERPYVVAEMSANHLGDFDRAVRIIEAAAAAGADAVKLQTYTAETLTIDCDGPPFRIGEGLWSGRTLAELYREAAMPWEWQPRLGQVARELGLSWFSTAYDATAVEFLEQAGVPAYKVASFELVDVGLLERVGATGKPVILSTGMATLGEIEAALGTLRAAGAGGVVLLKCTSGYPAAVEGLNLRTIEHLAGTFRVPVGLSDHTLELAVPAAAVALGAVLIEKHVTLSRADGGPDSAFSLEPDELRAVVQAVRAAQRAVGQVRYGASEGEVASRRFRRSLFVVEDVKAGERFTRRNVRSIRPADGLAPRWLPEVLGRTARRDVARGTPLRWDLIG